MPAQLLCLNAQYVVHNVELQQLLPLKQSFSMGLLLLYGWLHMRCLLSIVASKQLC